jgi:hypothetical protein
LGGTEAISVTLRYDDLTFVDGALTMLTANPRSWFSWDFTLAKNGESLADIDLSSWREKGALTIANSSYRVYREGLCSGAFVLESNGAVVARAHKPSAWTRRMVLEFGGTLLELKPQSAFTRGFQLLNGDKIIGSLSPSSFLNRKINVELPEDLPLQIRAFVVWLTVLLWKRDASAAA